MKNFVQDGSAITVTAPAAVASGDGVMIGNGLFGVAVDAAANGADVTIVTEGVFELPAAAGVAVGDEVEWSGTQVTDLSAGVKIGVAITAVSGGVAQVKIG